MSRRWIATFATAALVALSMAFTPTPVRAEMVQKSFTFALGEWHALDTDTTPITLHRIRLDRKDARFSKGTLSRPYNQKYLDNIEVQLEYTNVSDQGWSAKIDARWLDAEGRVIDGFNASEKLSKKSAQRVVSFALPTLKYGMAVAKTLEVEIHYEP